MPWHGEVLPVWEDFGELVRLHRPDDDTYHPDLNIARDHLVAEIRSQVGLELYTTCHVDGLGAFGIQKRYWSFRRGQVLYDLREWGNKPGHRDEVLVGIERNRLTPLFTS